MIVIVTHAVFLNKKDIYGPPHAVAKYLDKRMYPYIFIKHPLSGKQSTIIEYHLDGKIKKTINKKRSTDNLSVYLREFLITFNTVKSIKEKKIVLIGVDPLNAFAGIILKLIGKVHKTVYFSADFSPKRFENIILNAIYLSLDWLAMFVTDQTWSVSRRIQNYRKSKGLSAKKNLRMPNAPFFNEVPRKNISQIRKEDLVLVSNFTKDIDFFLLIDVVESLVKKISKVRLSLIGAGVLEEELRSYVKSKKLERHVLFLGTKSHEEMFEVLVKSGVGIALYTNSDKNHFRYFSDPMKVRDYLASGLPVIISGNSGINTELEKNQCGISVSLDKGEITKALKKIIGREETYIHFRERALELAKKHDTELLILKYLNEVQSGL